jgi:tetratricopeptide (TPR) repeat protein
MLETIREYGSLQLHEEGEIETARRRHADYFLDLARRAESRLEGPDQALWFDLLEAEHSNVQAALDWLLGKGEVETAVRIGTALWWFWWVRGHFGEMRWRMEQGLARSGTLPKALRANLLLASGVLISMDGDHERAVKLFEEAVALERERRDKTGIPRALRGFGLLISDRGEYARASVLFAEALVLDREVGDKHGESSDLRALGKMQIHLGNPAVAKEHFDEALALGQALGDRHGAAFSLASLGDAARHTEDHDLAAQMYREALDLFRELGSKPGVASSLNDLAETERLRGNLATAIELFGEALELLVALGHRLQIADCLAGLAAIALAKGQAERAARLYGVIESLRENARLVLSPADHAEYETTQTAAVVALGEEGFEQAFRDGKSLTYEQGIALGENSVDLLV